MNIRKTLALAAFAVVILATGCTRHVSRDISGQGAAGEVVFPSTDRLVLKEGTFPTREALSQVGPGVTKDQLYALLGRPHFSEGFHAREWDYLFHFRKGTEVTTCQFKVIFDRDYHGQSFHWMPAGCGEQGAEPVAKPAPVAQEQRFDLSGDALFAFGRYGETDILERGREELDAIAVQLKDANASSIRVVGHTDHIGDDRSNQLLSQRRAETVRAYLIAQGVRADNLFAVGVGESQPVKQCDSHLVRAHLVACLQPNRRVEIVASGMRP